MSGNKAELTVTVEEGGAGIDAGDTCTGTITKTELRSFEHDGDEVTYFDVHIEEDTSGITFNPGYPARVTEGTGLGQLLMRMGADLTIGEELQVHEHLKPGVDVAFEVEHEEGDDGDGPYLRVDKDTLRPADEADATVQPTETTDDGGDDGGADDDAAERVLDIVDENEGASDSDIKKLIVAEDGDLLSTYKDLKSSGDIEEVDGSVLLA